MSRFNVVFPIITGVRYSLSFSSGLAIAVPLSAADLRSAGTLAPNLVYTPAYIPGRLTVRASPWAVGLMSWLRVKPRRRGWAIGTADTVDRPARSVITLRTSILKTENKIRHQAEKNGTISEEEYKRPSQRMERQKDKAREYRLTSRRLETMK